MVAGAGAAFAKAFERGAGGIEALERRYYWSLLKADQKKEVEKALGDFLAETSPDRDLAASRLLRWRADAAAILSVDQRKQAGKSGWWLKHLTDPERREALDRLLDGTDREALARRLERLDGAAPEDRVAVGIEVFDQAYDLVEKKATESLALSDDQRTRLRALYGQVKEDLKPIALRLERAKADLRRFGLSLLDADQRAKFDAFHADLKAKVLAFVRKTPPK